MFTYHQVLLYALIPTIAMLLGGIVSAIHLPSPRMVSSVQHFAAGIVFAAVATELLPLIMHPGLRISISVGFLLGVLTMLFIKVMANQQQQKNNVADFPISLLTAVGVDLLIDGVLIGVAFLAKPQSALLIALALSFEIFFLGLSTIASLTQKMLSLRTKLFTCLLLTLLIPIGAICGWGIFSLLPSYWLTDVLAFGVAALLYLVVEELLVEAHEIEDTPWVTGMFFLGFLLVLLLDVTP